MKVFGSITELVSAIFRKNSQQITLKPSTAVTYTASRNVELPPQDAASVLVSEDASQALTNKTISGASNTLSNVDLASQVTGILPAANGGSGVNSTATFPTSGTIVTEAASEALTNKTIDADLNTLSNIKNAEIKAGAAIDATKIADGSVTSTEFQYIGGLTSDAQTQISSKLALAGGTLTGDLVMDNQKAVKLREQTGNGTNYVALEAPDAVTADTTWKLPNGDGTLGQVLKTDGSGNLGWVTATTATLFDPDTTTDGLVDGTNGLKAFTDGSSGAAGYLGETVESIISSGSAVSISSNTPTNITSINLQPGSYRIEGLCIINGTLVGNGWLLSLSDSNSTDGVAGDSRIENPTLPTAVSGASMVLSKDFNISIVTNIYLVANVNYSSGTATGFGRLTAHRVR